MLADHTSSNGINSHYNFNCLFFLFFSPLRPKWLQPEALKPHLHEYLRNGGRWSYMYHTVNKYKVNQMFFMQEKKQPIPRKDKNIISIQSHTVAYEQASP